MTMSPLSAIPVVGDLLKTALPAVADIIKAVTPLIQPFADAMAKKIGGEDKAPPSKPIEFPKDSTSEKLTINFTQ